MPSKKETYNVGSYFSGHYQSYGVNVQVTCDCNSCFTSISVLCPGGTGDSKAYAASYLYSYVSNLPLGFYLIADNAYTLSDMLLIPYSGQDKVDSSKDAFNFYLLQLCICIVSVKMEDLQKLLEVKLFHVAHIVQVCAQLHNFCIDYRDDSAPLILNRDPESFHWTFEAFAPLVQTLVTARARCCAVSGGNSCTACIGWGSSTDVQHCTE